MKFKLFTIFFIITACTTQTTKFDNRTPYNSKGFAYIFNDKDYEDKIIKGKLNNSELQISHSKLRYNALVKIINPKTKDYIVLKNLKKIKYPDFYKILITKKVAEKINLREDAPLVEIFEIKKNKSFIAKRAKIFSEEKTIPSNAPITSVEISNISKNKSTKTDKKNEFYILIASFYSSETAEFLKNRIDKEISSFDMQKMKIVKKSNKKIDLISGPYNTINLMKNDYILLKDFGFEDLDFIAND